MTTNSLVGAHEVSEEFGLSRMQLHRLIHENRFAEPVAVIRAGRIWRRTDVDRAVKRLKREGRLK